jgi:hypothetical protein
MKRSEMVKALQDRFNTSDVDAIADLADEIIAFLESKGMQPPKVERWEELSGTFLGEGFKVMKKVSEWEDEE